LILFSIALFASLFAGFVRQAMFMPLQYSAKGILGIFRRRAKRELEIMRLIGDSSFMLITYLCYYLIHEFLWAVGTSFVVFLVMSAALPANKNLSSATLFFVLFFGSFVARLINLYGFLQNLLNREKATKMLEEIVAGLPISR
jgi:hypothetical protein